MGCDGPVGVWFLLWGLDTWGLYVPGFGYATVLPLLPGSLGVMGPSVINATGDFVFPLPGVLPHGVPVNLQGVALSGGFGGPGAFTNRCRLLSSAW